MSAKRKPTPTSSGERTRRVAQSVSRIGSDMEKVDAHVITREEYEEIPELTREWFETADLKIGDKLIRRGRPPKVKKKVAISIRLSEDVLEAFKRCGPGWQTRIDEALEQFLEEHPERAPVTAPAPSVPDESGRSSPRSRRAR